jgi:ATP-dependent DNA helicase RecG
MPSDPISSLTSLPPKAAKDLQAAGLYTIADLVDHYPRRHEDRRQIDSSLAPSDVPRCVHVIIEDVQLRRSKGRPPMVEAIAIPAAEDALGNQLVCRWFNMPFLARKLAAGQELILFGKISSRPDRLIMDHPEFEELGGADADLHTGRIVPVYPLRESLTQKAVRKATSLALASIDPAQLAPILPNPPLVPASPPQQRPSRLDALRSYHFPSSPEDLDSARDHLALEEAFTLQAAVLARRHALLARGGTAHLAKGHLLADFLSALPFAPTEDQLQAIQEIRLDLAAPEPMARLLQGDVGSGKTLVAFAAALLAIEAGATVALMAPTQILAEQHYLKAREWLAPLGIRIALHTATRREESALPLFDQTADATPPQLSIGTHALLYADPPPDGLGLAIIDEQHKFGVAQRARLAGHGRAPDTLVLTATPIPRSLALTLYGDLEVSLIRTRPKGRGRITTVVRPKPKRRELLTFLKDKLALGQRLYLVYPLIDESEGLEAPSATAAFPAWQKALAPHAVELLHGRIAPDEKDATMARFRDGTTSALVATTVIEVGVDVPQATIMIIHGAERFGLAQLHQLRGRVGRGADRSFCVLIPSRSDAATLDKLSVLEKSDDGFYIAEEDLRRRGAGDLLGTAQSGLPPLRIASLEEHPEIFRTARSLAEATLAADPTLASLPHLRTLIDAARDTPSTPS